MQSCIGAASGPVRREEEKKGEGCVKKGALDREKGAARVGLGSGAGQHHLNTAHY